MNLQTLRFICIDFDKFQAQKNHAFGVVFFEWGAWRCPTLTWGDPTLPSALLRFTSEFGMGSGGTTMLWPPSKICFCFVL